MKAYRLALALVVLATPAAAYDRRDAAYVTTSKSAAVLDYVVCLEKAVRKARGSIPAKLQAAKTSCTKAARAMPRSASEPTADDIVMMVMECGFRPGDASPDMGC